MVAHIIQAGRADVVIREDVIESTSDPKPNSFFDSKTGILRVYHGPIYGNPFVSLMPAKAEQIGTMISHLNKSASVRKSESSINLMKKNNGDNLSSGTEMEKRKIALTNENNSSNCDANDPLLNFSIQTPQISDLHDEFRDDKYIRESLRTSSIATAYTLIDDPGHANELSKKSFVSNKDDKHNNNDDNNNFTAQSEKLQPSPETTDHKDDEWEKPNLKSSKSQRKKNRK